MANHEYHCTDCNFTFPHSQGMGGNSNLCPRCSQKSRRKGSQVRALPALDEMAAQQRLVGSESLDDQTGSQGWLPSQPDPTTEEHRHAHKPARPRRAFTPIP